MILCQIEENEKKCFKISNSKKEAKTVKLINKISLDADDVNNLVKNKSKIDRELFFQKIFIRDKLAKRNCK